MRKESSRDIVFGSASTVVALILLYEAMSPDYVAGLGDYGFSPVFFPTILIYVWIGLSVFIVARGIWSKRQAVVERTGSLTRPLLAFLLTCAYAILMLNIGFLFSTVIYSAVFLAIFGYRRWIPVTLVSLLFPLLMWYVFTFLLNVSLPASPWFSRM